MGALVDGQIRGELLDADAGLDAMIRLLSDPSAILVNAHIQYDLMCALERAARRGFDLAPLIYAKLADGLVYDPLLAQMLDDNAAGMLGLDQRTGGPLRKPSDNSVVNRHGLETVVDVVLGRGDAKARDEYRERYHELDGVPLHLWPPAARDYPVDDVVNTHEAALAQIGHLPKISEHSWIRGAKPTCANCGVALSLYAPPCRARRRHRNLHALADQVYMGFAMQAGAVWGFRVNQTRVDAVFDEIVGERRRAAVPLAADGFLRWDEKEKRYCKDTSRVFRQVALAFGASGTCDVCDGSGRIVSASGAKRKSPCPIDKGGCGVQPIEGQPGCDRCGVGCKKCSTTGLDLSTAPQLTLTDPSEKYEDGRISAKRDILNESGDEKLAELASYETDAKTETVYIPYLRHARRWLAQDPRFAVPGGTAGMWVDVPLTLKPNVFLETDRVSYGGSIHQFPRKGDLRSCIEARDGFTLSSVDYEAGEMITHAQSCLWIVGFSELAKALLKNEKPHDAIGSMMLGIDYAEFQKRFATKDPACVDSRQAAKPINFGCPGGIGPAKIVLQQRGQGPDTPHPNGPMMIFDENTGKMVRGYKGLRFCVLMDKAPRCGDVKVREWNRRPIPPTCLRCIECAHRLREIWFKRWTENKPYFGFVTDSVDNGQPTFDRRLEPRAGMHPWPRDGGRLDPGQVMLHLSWIIRGGVTFTDGANGYFQALLARAAKRAFRLIQRECMDRTVRVPDMMWWNSRRSAYAGGGSPLLGSRAIFLAHDESIAELRNDCRHDAAVRQGEIMRDSLRETCPDLADAVRADPALMPRWLKSAAPWWERGGKKPADDRDRLAPWSPEAVKAWKEAHPE